MSYLDESFDFRESAQPSDVLEHNPQHLASTPTAQPAHTAPYTAQQIADRYPDINPKEVTIRTRWFEWVGKVAPDVLLKDKKGFTDLAAQLFDDFVQKVKRDGVDGEDWVKDAKSRYSQEWSSVGVVDGELMPEEVGGQLALSQNRLTDLTLKSQENEQNLLDLIQQARSARATLSSNEIEAAKHRGKIRAVAKFQVTLQAELETEARLLEALEQ